MAQKEPPLDETHWTSTGHLDFYGGINTNTVHLYFYASNFFDATSLNHVLYQQANRFPDQHYLLHTRKAFEDAVKAVASGGIQFLVVGEPETEEGVWVIQKQQRMVQRGLPDEVEVLGTYYVTPNGFVLMAPSVGDVLAAKTLSITTNLSAFFTLASSLSLFTPATGHTYYHPSLKPAADPSKKALGGLSRATTPGRDPAIPADTASLAGATATTAPITSKIGGTFTEPLFMHSLNLAQAYGGEYADENPLQGEPGAFVLSSTNERVQAKNEAEARAALKVQSEALAASMSAERQRESGHSTAAPTPKAPIQGEGSGGSRKGSKGGGMDHGKLKRRKSRGVQSPVTPKEGAMPQGIK